MNAAVPKRIALVTAPAWFPLPPDEQLLAEAFGRLGLEPVAALWDDEAQDWGAYGAVVIRSCWDYHRRAALFGRFLDRLASQGARVFNPVATLRWNAHKSYLKELEAAGVPVVPTRWLARGAGVTLGGVLKETGWREVVVKPVVSASGDRTWRARAAEAAAKEAVFAAELAGQDLMVQPFVEQIAAEGEHSLVFLEGGFSHAVLKRPRHPEFRVQEEHGGTAHAVAVPGGVVRQAARALACAPEPTLYARVDGVITPDGFMLSELELVEPTLYFRLGGKAAERLAAMVARRT